MRPSAFAFFVAEAFLFTNVALYSIKFSPWAGIAWFGLMAFTWKAYEWLNK